LDSIEDTTFLKAGGAVIPASGTKSASDAHSSLESASEPGFGEGVGVGVAGVLGVSEDVPAGVDPEGELDSLPRCCWPAPPLDFRDLRLDFFGGVAGGSGDGVSTTGVGADDVEGDAVGATEGPLAREFVSSEFTAPMGGGAIGKSDSNGLESKS